MLRLLRWLIGYVEFTFTEGFAEGFLNECFARKYSIYAVQREGAALRARCPAALYPFLREVAKAHGGKLHIIKKRGMRFRFRELSGRFGLLAGLVCFAALVSFISGFVWNIELVGNEMLPAEQVLDFLAENGLHEGVSWHSVDKDRLESLLLASFDECAWAHINQNGTTARVEINEAVLRPDTFRPGEYANLKAKKDGVLVTAVVHDGWAVKQKGEAVVKGDLLVSGIYESEKGVNLFAHAAGEYVAQVSEPFSLSVSRTQKDKLYTAVNTYKSLVFFGLEIPLYLGSSEIKDSDVSKDYQYLSLNGVRLPIGSVVKTVKPYVLKERELNDSELNALLESEIEKRLQEDFGAYEIVRQDITVSLNSDAAVAKGSVLCLENIGEEVRLTAQEAAPESDGD